MDYNCMVYSDQLILPVIEQLQAENRPVTATEISQRTGVPYSTVKRRLYTLAKSQVITKTSVGRRWGSYLTIRHDTPNP